MWDSYLSNVSRSCSASWWWHPDLFGKEKCERHGRLIDAPTLCTDILVMHESIHVRDFRFCAETRWLRTRYSHPACILSYLLTCVLRMWRWDRCTAGKYFVVKRTHACRNNQRKNESLSATCLFRFAAIRLPWKRWTLEVVVHDQTSIEQPNFYESKHINGQQTPSQSLRISLVWTCLIMCCCRKDELKSRRHRRPRNRCTSGFDIVHRSGERFCCVMPKRPLRLSLKSVTDVFVKLSLALTSSSCLGLCILFMISLMQLVWKCVDTLYTHWYWWSALVCYPKTDPLRRRPLIILTQNVPNNIK
jgi:hypothetical protein